MISEMALCFWSIHGDTYRALGLLEHVLVDPLDRCRSSCCCEHVVSICDVVRTRTERASCCRPQGVAREKKGPLPPSEILSRACVTFFFLFQRKSEQRRSDLDFFRPSLSTASLAQALTRRQRQQGWLLLVKGKHPLHSSEARPISTSNRTSSDPTNLEERG